MTYGAESCTKKVEEEEEDEEIDDDDDDDHCRYFPWYIFVIPHQKLPPNILIF
jgi:hypothetical protein